MKRYKLSRTPHGRVITKDGHTQFPEDTVKDLNRIDRLERQLQSAVSERDAAWRQLEEANIDLVPPQDVNT